MQLTNEKLNELATKIAQAVAKNAGTAPELCHAPALFVLQDALQQQEGRPMDDDEIFEAANEHGSGRTATCSYLFRPAALLNFVRALRMPAPLIERPAGAVPAGYHLVPIEPRPECCDEGKDGSEVCCGNGKCAYLQEVESARAAVATVLASLPSTPAGPVPDEQAEHRAALQYVAMGDTVIDQIAAAKNRQNIYRMFGRDATLAFVRAIEFEVLARCCVVPSPAVAQPVADERMRQAIGTLRWMLNMTEDRPDATAAELFDETFTCDMKTTNRQTLEWLWAYLDPKNSRAARCQPAEEGDKA